MPAPAPRCPSCAPPTRPAPEAVERARRVLTAAEGRHGAFELDGAMVDEVVLAQARAVLRRADAARPASP
ncbi:hypothetical protein GY12_09290 [Micrococcus luteus]|nr:hypothetical protein GY12_09290 [Micrococcus luteus]